MAIEKYIIPGKKKKKKESKSKWTEKQGRRVCGIAESFQKGKYPKSVLAAVVQRLDGRIDGFGFSMAEVGGLNATTAVKKLLNGLERPDIQIILLNGTIISYYNVIDLHKVYNTFQKPIIAVTYEESSGIKEHLLEMEQGKTRLQVHKRNRERVPVLLHTGKKIYIRPVGISKEDSVEVLNTLVTHGKKPKPIRLAKLLASAVFDLISQEC